MTIQGPSNANTQQTQDACGVGEVCAPQGTTPPPTPTITAAWAGTPGPVSAPIARGGRDPVYLELGNVEVGTNFEIINVSKNPEASFGNAKDKATLTPTGRDVLGRAAGVFLNADQMQQIDLQPGDEFQIRAVDKYGNVSPAVSGQIEARNSTRNVAGRNWGGGLSNQQLLDGEATRKARDVQLSLDTRPPVFLEDHLHLAAAADGSVHVQMHDGLEPGSQVWVQNQLTGAVVQSAVDNSGNLDISLGKVTEATPLMIGTTSKDGVAGQSMEVIYGPNCPLGWTEKNVDTTPPIKGVIP
jgi:hypothetical protein